MTMTPASSAISSALARLRRFALTAVAATMAFAAPLLPQAGFSQTAPAPGLTTLADGRVVAPDIGRILSRGELVVAMNRVNAYPFFYERDGVPMGSDVDLMRDLAKELKVGIRFDRSPKTFDGVADLVAAGGADVGVSRLARTLARFQKVSFSNPYFKLNHALLINRVAFAKLAHERPIEKVIRGFDGSLGVMRASAWVEFARRNFPKARIVEFKSWKDVVEAVKRGEIVAGYRDEYETRLVLAKDPSLTLTLRTVAFDDAYSDLAVAVGIRDTALLAYINEFLAQRRTDISIAKLLAAAKAGN
ncbi:MAG TPA: transporter substrate-binding domain-containing protein [Beijerinckiaceae bacterium]|nr:transporter substrate-binding domain-containing protein [Rhodoblastus sp.]MCC0000500.1 transporter substrate-binding domain-containing protein [Methylobacteriaceae bacterium]MCO5088980.1 transporter substrate-binding domain-containing protein [Methylobacteriaceae bacterium]HRY03207.1 transporter substrate-binding domain-containing protein [Beijerinckiaceae bacterium]